MRKYDTWLAYGTAAQQIVNDGSIKLSSYLQELVMQENNNLELRVSAVRCKNPFLYLDPKTPAQRKRRSHLHKVYEQQSQLAIVQMGPNGVVDLPETHYNHIGVNPKNGIVYVCGVFDHIDILNAAHWNPYPKSILKKSERAIIRNK